MNKPIGVFDAGLGSYSIVDLIHQHYPQQDLIYYADRASFPYGKKTKSELLHCIGQAIDQLIAEGVSAVVLASNAPSVMILEEIKNQYDLPIIGVFPPVAQAIQYSQTQHVAILGVNSLINSSEIKHYVEQRSGQAQVSLVNASSLVDLVEDGSFLADPERTQQVVNQFMQQLQENFPRVDVCTLSSTHLPWLRPFFEKSSQQIQFIDPAELIVAQIKPYIQAGQGEIRCIATQTEQFPITGLSQMFDRLGIYLRPQLIEPSAKP